MPLSVNRAVEICFLSLVCSVCLASLSATSIRAQTITIKDKEGSTWDFHPGARVYNGNSNTFDSAPYFKIDSSNFSATGKKDTNNERLLIYGPQIMSQVRVTRKVLVPKDFAGAIFLEKLENQSDATVKVKPNLYWNMAYTIVDYKEEKSPDNMGTMIAAFKQSSSSASCVGFRFKSKGVKFKVSTRHSSDDYYVNFDELVIKPKSTVTLMHAVVQRNSVDSAYQAVKDLKLSKYIPMFGKDDARTLVNANAVDAVYDLSPMALFRGKERDLLVLTTGETISGEIQSMPLKIDTAYGEFEFDAQSLVSILSMGFKRYLFVLNDGTSVVGKPQFKGLKWQLLNKESLVEVPYIKHFGAKLTVKQKEDPLRWFDFKHPVFALRSGDRLVGEVKDKSWLMATAYGQVQIPVDKVVRIHFPNDERQIAKVTFLDGSQMSGVFLGQVSIVLANTKEIPLTNGEIQSVYFPRQITEDDQEMPALKLVHHDVLKSRLKPGVMISLRTPLGVREIRTNQVKAMRRGVSFGAGVSLTLWDGTQVPGRLVTRDLPYQMLDGLEINIPASLIQSYTSPYSEPPELIADKVKQLIKDLGDSKLAVRSDAEAKLLAYGQTIRGMLLRFKEEGDLETQLRIEAILKKMPAK